MAKATAERDKDSIVNISNNYFTEADMARKPVKTTWDRMWNIYNNCYDFSSKAEWQSQSYVPKIPNTVRMASSVLKRSLIRAKEFYNVDTHLKQFKIYSPAIQSDLKIWLLENKFVEQFTESLMMAMLTNMMIFKVFWRYDENDINTADRAIKHDTAFDLIKDKQTGKVLSPAELMMQGMAPPALQGVNVPGMNMPQKSKKGSLVISAINPYFFFIDPTGRNKYCFHVVTMDLADLKDRAAKMGYDMQEINKIEGSFTKQDWDYREDARKGQASNTPSSRKQVVLYEYWGDVINEDGDILHKNVTWTIANEKYCIRKPTANPNWHGQWPFAYGPIVKRPFSVYHKGYLEDVYGLAMTLTDIFNSLVDADTYAKAKAFEIDIDMVYDPEQLLTGIYPGKTMLKRSNGNPNSRLVQEITLGQISPQSLRLYQEADRELQNGTGLTEFLAGKPASRGRPTATEIVEKGAQAMSIMEDMAFDIEDGVLAPLLELSYKTLLQYQTDFTDPRMQALDESIRVELSAFQYLPATERKKAIDAFKFRCRGMSGVVAKSQEMQKALSYAQIIAQTPDDVKDRVDWQRWHRMVLEGMNWDPDTILLPERVYQQKLQMKQQMLQQQLALEQAKAAQGKQPAPAQPQPGPELPPGGEGGAPV